MSDSIQSVADTTKVEVTQAPEAPGADDAAPVIICKATQLKLEECSNNKFKISWDAGEGVADNWTVQMANSGFLASWQTAGSTSDAEYTLENLTPYSAYLVRVCAVHDGMDGDFSDPLRVTTLSDAEWQQKRAAAADELETAVEDLKARTAEQSAELETASAQVELLKVAAARADSQAAEHQEAMRKAEESLAKLRTELSETQSAMEASQANLAATDRELDDVKTARTDLEEALAAKDDEIEQLKSELQNSTEARDNSVAELTAQLTALQVESDNMKEAFNTHSTLTTESKEVIADLEQRVAEAEAACVRAEEVHAEQISAKQAELEQQKTALEQQKMEVDRLTAELAVASSSTALDALRTERAGLRQTAQGLELQVQGLRQTEAELKREVEPLQAKVDALTRERDDATRQVANLTEQLSAEEAERHVTETELVDARREAKRLSTLTAGLNGEIVHSQQKLEDMSSELALAQSKLRESEERSQLQATHIEELRSRSAPSPDRESDQSSQARVCTVIAEGVAFFKHRGKTADTALEMALQIPSLLEFGYGVDRVQQALMRFPKPSQMNQQVDWLLGSASPAPVATDAVTRPPPTAQWE